VSVDLGLRKPDRSGARTLIGKSNQIVNQIAADYPHTLEAPWHPEKESIKKTVREQIVKGLHGFGFPPERYCITVNLLVGIGHLMSLGFQIGIRRRVMRVIDRGSIQNKDLVSPLRSETP